MYFDITSIKDGKHIHNQVMMFWTKFRKDVDYVSRKQGDVLVEVFSSESYTDTPLRMVN